MVSSPTLNWHHNKEEGITIRIIITTITVALFAVSANAHEYVKRGNTVSAAEQWDITLPAPFTRDQNDRFGQ